MIKNIYPNYCSQPFLKVRPEPNPARKVRSALQIWLRFCRKALECHVEIYKLAKQFYSQTELTSSVIPVTNETSKPYRTNKAYHTHCYQINPIDKISDQRKLKPVHNKKYKAVKAVS